jgi:hypothetical protein
MPIDSKMFGVTFSTLTHDEIVTKVTLETIAKSAGPRSIFTANLDHIVQLRLNDRLRRAYGRAWVVTADGMPVFLYAKVRGARMDMVLFRSMGRKKRSQFGRRREWHTRRPTSNKGAAEIYSVTCASRACRTGAASTRPAEKSGKVSSRSQMRLSIESVYFDLDVSIDRHRCHNRDRLHRIRAGLADQLAQSA